ncbi:DUF998 domain-containing protein [Streptomyces sp. AC495_CC817]|uniref:DUF998 domain-containing protein n=1 Tax=Streptomyces sp. AC495_CC817 TaxID=2823900 RepID=UPI001C2566CE|nr:hypothetical protein [Streptomyces sp. AC495_CC817]
MGDEAQRLRGETEAVWATAVSFALGLIGGVSVLGGDSRALTGPHGLALPVAAVAAVVAAAAFAVSTLQHRRTETSGMPRWQATVSTVSESALTLAFAAVTGMGVLLAAEVLASGLQGLRLGAPGGGMLAGVAAAVGGRFAYGAGIRLHTADLAGILFGYLVIGTLFAMATAADARWWEHNFSTLGGGGAWAFNGTLVIAGLLVATVGSYIGRDLHRLLGDAVLGRIARVVVLWATTGAALAAVGLLPLDRLPVPHDVAAFSTLALFTVAAVATALTIPSPPAALVVTTVGVVGLVVVALVLCFGFGLYGVTALEAIVVGLGLLWMATLVRVLAILAPPVPRPSARATLRAR